MGARNAIFTLNQRREPEIIANRWHLSALRHQQSLPGKAVIQ
jgi:hypothetical protein